MTQRTALGRCGRLLSTLAVQQGLHRAKQIVVLLDEVAWMWRLVEKHVSAAVQMVDLWQAKPHIWEVLQAVYGRTTPEGIAWANQGCSWLVQGQIQTLVHSLAAFSPVAPSPGHKRRVPEQAVDYCTTNAAACAIRSSMQKRMPVGSGEALATCKTVVSTRAKRTGMQLPSSWVGCPFASAHRRAQWLQRLLCIEQAIHMLQEGAERLFCFGADEQSWDDTWSVVAFSIPEKERTLRPMLRTRLRQLTGSYAFLLIRGFQKRYSSVRTRMRSDLTKGGSSR